MTLSTNLFLTVWYCKMLSIMKFEEFFPAFLVLIYSSIIFHKSTSHFTGDSSIQCTSPPAWSCRVALKVAHHRFESSRVPRRCWDTWNKSGMGLFYVSFSNIFSSKLSPHPTIPVPKQVESVLLTHPQIASFLERKVFFEVFIYEIQSTR